MKKSILTWVLLLTVSITSTFANNKIENVNETVISSFKKDFASAQEVTWEKSKEVSKATFIAVYNAMGKMALTYD